MNAQMVKWVRTLTPAVMYLALHQLLRICGVPAPWRPWLILPAAVVCYSREEKHAAGNLKLSSVRGAALTVLTAGAAAWLNAWCFPGTAGGMTPGMLAATVIAGPVCEELLYRGIVFDRGCRFFGCGQAMAVSAVLFGLAHTGAAQMASAAVFGGILCLLRMHFSGIAAPILVHSCVNLLAACGTLDRIPKTVLAIGAMVLSGLTVWLLCRGNSNRKSRI